jgi:hypothetical protein
MQADGTGTGDGGRAGNGLTHDPRLLAAGAGGLLAACLVLWAFRGLPLGPIAFWAAPLPLFMVGIGFGPGPAVGALAVATAVSWVSGTETGTWLFLLAFGIPAVLLVGAASADLGRALALLGVLPAAGIVAAAIWLADAPGGLEGTLQAMARAALRRFEVPASAGLVADIVRVKAAAIGFWLSLAMLANAWAAGRLLRALGVATPPAWSTARLPGWYIALPALALGFWLAADDEADAIQLSVTLVLLVPLMLHGLAAMHRRTQGRGERPLLLGAVYLCLVILFLPASLAVAGYGAFDLIVRPSSSNNRGRGGTPPASPRS